MLWRFLRSAFRPRALPDEFVNRSLALRKEGRLRDAEQLLREATARFSRDAVVATNLGVVLLEQDHGEEGVACLQRALEFDPRCAPAHYNLANVMRASGRRDLAVEHYQAATDADHGFAPAREELMHCLLELCDWDRADVQADALRAIIARRPAAEWMRYVSPLTALYLGLEPALLKEVAAYHVADYARGITVAARSVAGDAARLRIGYLSRDFRDHAVGHVLANVFALHDRARFEIHAFSYGPDDGSIYRQAIAAGVDRFVDAHAMTDSELAATIVAAGIHILVDLAGHTTGHRMPVLARRPAPVQAHYLGFPATTGATYIDYFITDGIATPPALAAGFTEKLAYLPQCFMVSDGTDALSVADDASAAPQFAAEAIVFCNFNNASRITRGDFGAWMEILRDVPQGVLWLQGAGTATAANLQRQAQACGTDPARLVFAQRVPTKRQHLARLKRADLVLDTIGWHNGHSSTSDALWSGVPVLTAPTQYFAGRVAASLVSAAGLPELVKRDRAEYVKAAVQLGNDRAQLAALKQKLADNRRAAPFFDTRRLVRDLEAAYIEMWNEHCGGTQHNAG
jgi:predicted O-linked N-acetylglucosamine transferase (SPINDLY family)